MYVQYSTTDKSGNIREDLSEVKSLKKAATICKFLPTIRKYFHIEVANFYIQLRRSSCGLSAPA
jgi:hypothetical protein